MTTSPLFNRCAWRVGWLLPVITTSLLIGCSPQPQSVKPGINEAYFETPDPEAWSERFEIESREIYTHRDKILAELELRPGMAIADVGCGTGFFTLMMAKAVGPTGTVYAVDILPEFTANAARRAVHAGINHVKPVTCTAFDSRLPVRSIDLVYICDTYHHFEYPSSTMKSIRRALRPGGLVALVDFERIPGVSEAWILSHVRAGKEEVIREMETAGFEFVKEGNQERYLVENYFLWFQRVG